MCSLFPTLEHTIPFPGLSCSRLNMRIKSCFNKWKFGASVRFVGLGLAWYWFTVRLVIV